MSILYKSAIALSLLILLVQNTHCQDDTSGKIFGYKDEHLVNFTGEIYYLPENTDKLPDFKKLKPVGKIYTNYLNIKNQAFSIGFPGVTNRFEYFAIDYKAKFYLKDSCTYFFTLCSDDGSKLLIDNKVVVDNDFGHSVECKTNHIKLQKGMHDIEVQYYQGPREYVALMLRYRKIGEKTNRLFNLENFFPISVTEKDSLINISIGDEILFDFNSYQLNDVAMYTLNEIKRVIIDKTKVKSIIIEGHTDDVGTEDYNLKLSVNRATTVKSYLTKQGVESKYLITKGLGESKPKVENTNDENRRKNRRIEMSIVKGT